MRVTRALLVLLTAAFAMAGCAAEQPYVQMQPAPYGIDNVTYGTSQPGYQAGYARPAYAQPGYVQSGYAQPAARGFFQPVYAAPGYAQPAQSYVPPAQTYPQPVQTYPQPVQSYAQPVHPAGSALYAYGGGATPGSSYQMPQSGYTLDSGDRLRVVVFGQDGLTNSYVVDASGHIAMPLIGSVAARGMSTDQLASAISEKLRNGYIREPHVAVEVEAYRPFFILGEVTQPGQYPYVANMTAETAVAIAGGFGPRAFRKSAVLIRTYMGQQIRTEVPLSYQLRPGDTINIQERWF
jgi:polysaccharide biosynthesis/export protein